MPRPPVLIQLGQLRAALAKLETIPCSDAYFRCAVFQLDGDGPTPGTEIAKFSGDVMLVQIEPQPKVEPKSPKLTTSSWRTADKPLLLFSQVPASMRGEDETAPKLAAHVHRCQAATGGKVNIVAEVDNRFATLLAELSLNDFGNIRFHQCRAAGTTEAKTLAPGSLYLCPTHRKVLQARGQHAWWAEIKYLRKKYGLPDTAGCQLL